MGKHAFLHKELCRKDQFSVGERHPWPPSQERPATCLGHQSNCGLLRDCV